MTFDLMSLEFIFGFIMGSAYGTLVAYYFTEVRK